MVTFGKIFEAWKAEKMLYVKESSMATYLLLAEKHLLPVFKDATEIKERDAQAFVIQKLQNGLSQKTTKDCIIVLRMILRYADKNDWWICRPWDLRYPPVKNVKKLSVMSQKEQKILMNYLAMNYSLRNLGIHFHTLRHTFATRCIESNCDVKTVSSILGHTNISTTLNVYVHPNMEHKRKCIDQMLESLR